METTTAVGGWSLQNTGEGQLGEQQAGLSANSSAALHVLFFFRRRAMLRHCNKRQ